MHTRVATSVGLVGALVSALVWALDLVLVKLPAGVGLPGNNTYWARDIRFMAITAIFVGVVLVARGSLRVALPATAGFGVWIVADIQLDRRTLSGSTNALVVALVAGVVVAAACAVARRNAHFDRLGLTVAAMIALAMAPFALAMESPTDSETSLLVLRLSMGATFIVLGAASAACATTVRPQLAVVIVSVVFVLGEVPATAYLASLAWLTGAFLLGGGVAAIRQRSGDRRQWSGYVQTITVTWACFLGAALALLVLTVFVFDVGAVFTELAGKEAVNSADSDSLYTLVGIAIGLGATPFALNVASSSDAVPASQTIAEPA